LSPFQTPANTPTVLLCRLLRKRLLLGTLYYRRSHHRRYLRHWPRKSRSDPPSRSFLMFSLSITPLVAVISRAVAQCRVGVVQRKTTVAPNKPRTRKLHQYNSIWASRSVSILANSRNGDVPFQQCWRTRPQVLELCSVSLLSFQASNG
jgi:hypothetical protein